MDSKSNQVESDSKGEVDYELSSSSQKPTRYQIPTPSLLTDKNGSPILRSESSSAVAPAQPLVYEKAPPKLSKPFDLLVQHRSELATPNAISTQVDDPKQDSTDVFGPALSPGPTTPTRVFRTGWDGQPRKLWLGESPYVKFSPLEDYMVRNTGPIGGLRTSKEVFEAWPSPKGEEDDKQKQWWREIEESHRHNAKDKDVLLKDIGYDLDIPLEYSNGLHNNNSVNSKNSSGEVQFPEDIKPPFAQNELGEEILLPLQYPKPKRKNDQGRYHPASSSSKTTASVQYSDELTQDTTSVFQPTSAASSTSLENTTSTTLKSKKKRRRNRKQRHCPAALSTCPSEDTVAAQHEDGATQTSTQAPFPYAASRRVNVDKTKVTAQYDPTQEAARVPLPSSEKTTITPRQSDESARETSFDSHPSRPSGAPSQHKFELAHELIDGTRAWAEDIASAVAADLTPYDSDAEADAERAARERAENEIAHQMFLERVQAEREREDLLQEIRLRRIARDEYIRQRRAEMMNKSLRHRLKRCWEKMLPRDLLNTRF